MDASPQGSSAAPDGRARSQEIERVPRISVTWMGHSTVLVEVDGVRILTDPLVTRRLAHLRRRAPTPTVAPVDVVLISHVHMDHLHLPSLRRTARGARLIVPDGAGRLVRKLPVRSVEEVRQRRDRPRPRANAREVGGRCRGCPRPPPFGSRSALERDRAAGRVRDPDAGRAVYFAGDTDLFDSMRTLGPLDVALLPIWGWGRTLGERHLNPETAATATTWLDPTTVVPIHWGTYSALRFGGRPAWIDQPPNTFRDALARLGLQERLCLLQPGDSLQLDTDTDVN